MSSNILLMDDALSHPAITLLLVNSYSKSEAGHARYDVEVHFSNGEKRMLRKRYSEFFTLHEGLKKCCNEVNGFSFPTRTMGLTMDRSSVLRSRKQKFEQYINKVDIMTKRNDNKEPLRILLEWILNGSMDEGTMHCAVLARFPEVSPTESENSSFSICIETRSIPSEPPEGHVLVQVFGAGVSASDVALCHGKMPFVLADGLPFVCGRDFCGLVVKGSIDMLGKMVLGTGVLRSGELSRADGSHAQFLSVSESSLIEKPNSLGIAAASCLGIPFTTAWVALHDFCLEPLEVYETTDSSSLVLSRHGSGSGLGASKHSSLSTGSTHDSNTVNSAKNARGSTQMFGWPRTPSQVASPSLGDPLAPTDCVVVLGSDSLIGRATLELAKMAGCSTIAVRPSTSFIHRLSQQHSVGEGVAALSDQVSDTNTDEWDGERHIEDAESMFRLEEEDGEDPKTSPQMIITETNTVEDANSEDLEMSFDSPTESLVAHHECLLGPVEDSPIDWFEGWSHRFQKTVLTTSHGKGATVIVDCVGVGALTHAAIECASRRARVRVVDSVMSKTSAPLRQRESDLDESDDAAAGSSPVESTLREHSPSIRQQVGMTDESASAFLSEVGLDLRAVALKQLDLRAVSSLDINSEHGGCIMRHIIGRFHPTDSSLPSPTTAALTAPALDIATHAFSLGQSLAAFELMNRQVQEECAVVCPSGVEMLE